MIEFYRQLAHNSRKWSLREQYPQRNTSLLPIAFMKSEHVTMLLTKMPFTEELEGGCHPSFWLLLSFWVPNPNSLEGFCRGWSKGNASLLKTYLFHTMNLCRRMAGEALTSKWWLRKWHTHISFFPSLLPCSTSSLSPKMCIEYKMSFFPLRAAWTLAANPGTFFIRLMGPRSHQGPPASTPIWCQEHETRSFSSSTTYIKGKSPVSTSITSLLIGPATAQGQKSDPRGRTTS